MANLANTKNMNILVIGLGSAGQRHLRILSYLFKETSDIYVYRGQHKRGLISSNLQEENMHIDPIQFYGVKELLHREDFQTLKWDLSVIAIPPKSHLEYFQLIFSNSNRILIEKPVSTDLVTARAIQKIATENNKSVLIGYQIIFHELVQILLEYIKELGDIESCNIVFIESLAEMNPFRKMHSHHLANPEGGGVFLGLSHDLDLTLFLFGVNGYENLNFTNILRNSAEAIIECDLSVNLFSSKGSIPTRASFSISDKSKRRTLTINGSKAKLELNLVSQTITVGNYHGEIIHNKNLVIDKDLLFRDQAKYLLGINEFNSFCENNLNRSMLIAEMNESLCKTR
jgi:predicted dehydrogenase